MMKRNILTLVLALITLLLTGQPGAVNGTFFNMREGCNVHYVRVDDSLIAVTDEGEFGIRATGVFTATGEVANILPWGSGAGRCR